MTVLITGATRGEPSCRSSGATRCGRDASSQIKGYLGAFEVEWEQANPIDLEVCTRCNACIQRLSRAGDRLLVPDRSRQVQGAPQVRDGVRRDQGDRFRARRDAPQRALRSRARSERPAAPRCAAAAAGLFRAGRATRSRWRARCASSRSSSGEFEKPKFFDYKEKICAHSRSEIVGCTQLHRRVLDARDRERARGEPRQGRAAPVHGLRRVRDRVSVGRDDLRLSARRRHGRAAARPCCRPTARRAARTRACCFTTRRRARADRAPGAARQGAAGARDSARSAAHRLARARSHAGQLALGAAQVAILCGGLGAAGISARRSSARCGYAQEIVSGLGLGEGAFQADRGARRRRRWRGRCGRSAAPRALAPATFNLSNEKRAHARFRVRPPAQARAGAQGGDRRCRAGAPYGAVVVDKQKCTMCLACVGACPEGALLDAKDKPQLQVHRAQLRAVRAVREDLPRGRDHARAAAAAHAGGEAAGRAERDRARSPACAAASRSPTSA